jgi:hypothetical protein
MPAKVQTQNKKEVPLKEAAPVSTKKAVAKPKKSPSPSPSPPKTKTAKKATKVEESKI